MSWRRITMSAIAAFIALFGLIGATTFSAAPQPVYSAPREGAKMVLADTSIDGPAIRTTYAPATVIAWSGTDTLHHLNLMTSSDGLHYSNKIILPEYSPWRPALAFIDSGRGAPYGTIVLAWTGGDANHTLNLEFIKTPGYSVIQKITFWGETSFTAPALTTINGDINSYVYLSWAGTDSAHTLNVMRRNTVNPITQTKKTLWGWSSISRPSLMTDQAADATNPLLLAWTGTNNRIHFATSADGKAWSEPSASPLTAMSAWAPGMTGFYASTLPDHWLTWTGSGSSSTHRITVRYTQRFPAWDDANVQTTLDEWAISSPDLAYNGAQSSVLLAWTGVDSEHHLNVAMVSA